MMHRNTGRRDAQRESSAEQPERPSRFWRLAIGAIRLIFAIAGVVLVLLGLSIVASGWSVVRSATQTLSWLPADGQITRSQASWRTRGAGSPMVIHYAYWV